MNPLLFNASEVKPEHYRTAARLIQDELENDIKNHPYGSWKETRKQLAQTGALCLRLLAYLEENTSGK
jgi:hypothetical protein